MKRFILNRGTLPVSAFVFLLPLLWAGACSPAAPPVSVRSLLKEMTDLKLLSERPRPFFKQASESSYDRESRKGGEAWFANKDVGQYVRTETNAGRREHVLADLPGPGAITRFWSANPDRDNIVRFYFDGETIPRIELPLSSLFTGTIPPWKPEFSYVSGTGGNLYYPIPFAASLKITIEGKEKPLRLYYEIGHRSFPAGTKVETYDPTPAADWAEAQAETAQALTNPGRIADSDKSRTMNEVFSIAPGETAAFPEIRGPKAVVELTARIGETKESGDWTDPRRAQNAWRTVILEIDFDGEKSVEVPLGDFFGSAPGVNPYENLFFTVTADGTMTSRLQMPFKKSMRLRLRNTGRVLYKVDIVLRAVKRAFRDGSYHLRAQWGSLTRESQPPFDVNFLETAGEGKVVGTVYQIANPALIWWGEGDQKISVDGEPFPSTFGTGTEDDYGYAYGDNRPYVRPYHAQTRVYWPWSGGHISLKRCNVLDALPYHSRIRFDQEIWHWMPCRPTWTHVIYWYALPGTPGPQAVDPILLPPRDLGIREDMLEPFEGEALVHKETGGTAATERLANCSGAEHLVWRNARKGHRLIVHFPISEAGRYAIELNLCQSPDYGRYKFFVNDSAAAAAIDAYSPKLFCIQAPLGVFELKQGDNTLTAEILEPNPKAAPGNLLGLDYIFLVKKEERTITGRRADGAS
ncbi:MAG: glycoside hydrolase family 172 protein [Candidatus Aminicenantales bacterium]